MRRLHRMNHAGLLLVALASHLMTGAANAHTFSVIKRFGNPANVTGFEPSPLVQGTDGTLYGATFSGEANVKGTVFKVQPDGSGFTTLKSFTNFAEGAEPYYGSALALSGNTLYGTTLSGGIPGAGTVFKVNTDGSGFTVLKHFPGADGASPQGLTLSGNELYGVMRLISPNEMALFKLKTDGTGFTVLKEFLTIPPQYPIPEVFMTVSDSIIYGASYFDYGGNPGSRWIFKMNTDGTGYTVLRSFSGSEGTPATAPAQQGGVLYGTMWKGGNANHGTVFKMNTDGTGYIVLKHFSAGTFDPSTGKFINSDGSNPGRVTVSGSSLYGTTWEGGSSGAGTVFKVNMDGSGFTVLKHFTGSDVWGAPGLMVSGSTLFGPAMGGISYRGTLFKLNTDGTGFMVLKEFTYSDAAAPRGLILSGNTWYGTTREGGNLNAGTVFKLNDDGTGYTILKHFAREDGVFPEARLTLSGNTLYGTASWGRFAEWYDFQSEYGRYGLCRAQTFQPVYL